MTKRLLLPCLTVLALLCLPPDVTHSLPTERSSETRPTRAARFCPAHCDSDRCADGAEADARHRCHRRVRVPEPDAGPLPRRRGALGLSEVRDRPFRVEARQTVRIDAGSRWAAWRNKSRSAAAHRSSTPRRHGVRQGRQSRVQQLPFTFRTQNTSPIPAIQAIPEVQRVGEQFSLSGALPYQTEVSVDGILTTSVRRNGIGAEGINVFPSIESVEEIKVSSVNNTAEFAQLGDITTVSRPGTNQSTAQRSSTSTAPASTPTPTISTRRSRRIRATTRTTAQRRRTRRAQPNLLLRHVRAAGHQPHESAVATYRRMRCGRGLLGDRHAHRRPVDWSTLHGNRIPAGTHQPGRRKLLQATSRLRTKAPR